MRHLKKWIRNELQLKIISLVLAVILWFYISPEVTEHQTRITKTQIFKDVPVDIMGSLGILGTNLKITPETVNLEVGAAAKTIGIITRDDIKAYVEIKGLSIGKKYRLPLRVVLPGDIVLVSEPQVIEVEIGVLR